jgi:hypothetical protein
MNKFNVGDTVKVISCHFRNGTRSDTDSRIGTEHIIKSINFSDAYPYHLEDGSMYLKRDLELINNNKMTQTNINKIQKALNEGKFVVLLQDKEYQVITPFRNDDDDDSDITYNNSCTYDSIQEAINNMTEDYSRIDSDLDGNIYFIGTALELIELLSEKTVKIGDKIYRASDIQSALDNNNIKPIANN